MDDLIGRQAAIDVLDKIFPADPMRNDYTQGITCGAALATEYIKQLPSAEPRWVPVTKRLPEKYIGEWLCCTDDGKIMILPYDTPGDGSKECVFYEWDDDGYFYHTFNVIAWMPLPEPYGGDLNE